MQQVAYMYFTDMGQQVAMCVSNLFLCLKSYWLHLSSIHYRTVQSQTASIPAQRNPALGLSPLAPGILPPDPERSQSLGRYTFDSLRRSSGWVIPQLPTRKAVDGYLQDSMVPTLFVRCSAPAGAMPSSVSEWYLLSERTRYDQSWSLYFSPSLNTYSPSISCSNHNLMPDLN